MGLLGDALEVIYRPREPFRTVRACVKNRIDYPAMLRASQKHRPVVGRRRDGADGDPIPAKFSRSFTSIWLERPGSVRIEKRSEIGGFVDWLTVTDGHRLWERDPDGHVEVSDPEVEEGGRKGLGGIGSELAGQFEPSRIREIFHCLALEPLGGTEVAGRECVRVRGVRRPGAILWPHWLASGADEYEFHLDVERGALLGILSIADGEAFDTQEALEVAFDEPLESGLFTYTPGHAEQVIRPNPAIDRLTISAAAAKAPFAVLIPSRVPDPDRSTFEVLYYLPDRHRGHTLTLMYRGSQMYEHLWVTESGRPDLGHDEFEWELLADEGTGRKDLRISEPPGGVGERLVAFEQDGTHVMIRTDIERTQLIALAKSFVLAAGGPSTAGS